MRSRFSLCLISTTHYIINLVVDTNRDIALPLNEKDYMCVLTDTLVFLMGGTHIYVYIYVIYIYMYMYI